MEATIDSQKSPVERYRTYKGTITTAKDCYTEFRLVKEVDEQLARYPGGACSISKEDEGLAHFNSACQHACSAVCIHIM